MTVLCGGGASSTKPGLGGILSITGAGIELFIASVLVLPELAPVLAPVIAGLIDIELSTYCATDPPADPGLTAADVISALETPASAATFTAQQKIVTWFESQYWWQVCQCSSTTTPSPPTPSNPGQVTTNPGPGVTPSACWNVTVPYSVPAFASGHSNITDITTLALPAGPTFPVAVSTGPPAGNVMGVKFPAVMLNPQMAMTVNEPLTGSDMTVQWNGFTATGAASSNSTAQLGLIVFKPGIGTNVTAVAQPTTDNTATYFAVYIHNLDSSAHTGTINVSMFCPPGIAFTQPCNCTDPLVEGELNQILQYVQAIYAGLPIPPNSFAEATVHSGLSGAGSITFTGVPIALKVTLTTIPGIVGVEIGDPNFYFDVGYLSFGTSEGNYAQQRLSLQQELVSVPLLSGSVGYTLNNGVIATITELVAGP